MNVEALAEKLANEHRPKFFRDFITNDEYDLGSPANILRETIKKNYHSVLGNIALLGPSGCGKSSLSKLHSRATLCYNRLEGDYEPCGECPVCLGEDTSNIAEYTIHNPTAAWEPVRELIQLSRQAPVINREGIRADQYYRFIILNEIQQASPELLALLYDAMEYAPATTIWILISMDEDKLRKKSEQTAEAIIGRCADLHLSSFSDSAMTANIVSKTDINYDAAMAIAKLSKGNMRRVWNNVASYRVLVDEDSEITEDLVLYSRSGGATKENRLTMWQALAKGDGKTVKGIIDEWTEKAADIKLVGNLLQMDIIDNLHSPSSEVQSLLAALGRWYTGISYPLTTVFMSHLGTKVIQFPNAAERELRKQVKKDVVVDKPVTEQLVAQLALKALSNTHKLPALLFAKTYKELMLHYDKD